MAQRTKEQILDQAVYVVALLASHYGPGFSDEGLVFLRGQLAPLDMHTDSCYRTDVHEDDPHVDFASRVAETPGHPTLGATLEEVVAASRGEDVG